MQVPNFFMYAKFGTTILVMFHLLVFPLSWQAKSQSPSYAQSHGSCLLTPAWEVANYNCLLWKDTPNDSLQMGNFAYTA